MEYIKKINIILIISLLLFSCGAEDMWSRLKESGIRLHIIYDANGGEGDVPIDTNGYLPGDEAIILGNSTGMTNGSLLFNGWTLDTGEIYTQGESLILGVENITLYAKWVSSAPYTIKYDANGGTGDVPIDTTNYNTGDVAIILDNTGGLKNDEHIFSGWNIVEEPPDSSDNFAPGSEYTINSADASSNIITFYAQWDLPVMVEQDYASEPINSDMFATKNISIIGDSVNIPANGSINSRDFRIPAIIEGVATIYAANTTGINSFEIIRVPLPPAFNKKNHPTGFYFSADPGSDNIITNVSTISTKDGPTQWHPENSSYAKNTEYTYKIVLYNTYQRFYINNNLVRTTNYELKSTVWWTFRISGVNNNTNHLLDSISIKTIEQRDEPPGIP
jgi:hypothetical protein